MIEVGSSVWIRGRTQCCDDAQRGDPAAVDGLLRVLLPTAYRFAAHSCASPEDAEDAAQEALTSWLYVAIRNACLRKLPEVVLVPLDVVTVERAAIADPIVDRVVVAEALASLPDGQRVVVVLVDLLGLPIERAAMRLGIGVAATKSRLHRARRALAAVLSEASARRVA